MESTKLSCVLSCAICFSLFDDGKKCPRILSCGHTFCHSCIEKLLRQSPSCPMCKSKIQSSKVESIAINYSFKEIISLTSQDHVPCEAQANKYSEESSCSTAGKLESVGYCMEHSSCRNLRCMDCQLWICGMCGMLHHKRCRTLLVRDVFEELKKQVCRKVLTETGSLKQLNYGITNSLATFLEKKNNLMEKAETKDYDLIDCDNRIKNLNFLLSENKRFGENLENLKASIVRSKDGMEFAKAYNEFEKLMIDHEKGLSSLLKTLEVGLSNRRSIPNTIEELKKLCDRKHIYVVRNGSAIAYGMVRVSQGQIYISCFQFEKRIGVLFPLKGFIERYCGENTSPKMAFLMLAPEGRPYERIEIVIKTDGKSPRALNYLILCSGTGLKYKGQILSFDEGSSLCTLKCNIPPVAKGISETKNFIPLQWEEGLVMGMNENNSGFQIASKNCAGSSYPKIGFVVSGLENLKKWRNFKLIIKDCGTVT